jgi:hypothetical protein
VHDRQNYFSQLPFKVRQCPLLVILIGCVDHC